MIFQILTIVYQFVKTQICQNINGYHKNNFYLLNCHSEGVHLLKEKTKKICNPNMGLIYTDIQLINSNDLAIQRSGYIHENKIRKMNVNVLLDSGAVTLSINESIKVQLGLPALDRQMGGSLRTVPNKNLTLLAQWIFGLR